MNKLIHHAAAAMDVMSQSTRVERITVKLNTGFKKMLNLYTNVDVKYNKTYLKMCLLGRSKIIFSNHGTKLRTKRVGKVAHDKSRISARNNKRGQ